MVAAAAVLTAAAAARPSEAHAVRSERFTGEHAVVVTHYRMCCVSMGQKLFLGFIVWVLIPMAPVVDVVVVGGGGGVVVVVAMEAATVLPWRKW